MMMFMKNVSIEKKIWKGSPVAGMTIEEIESRFGIKIWKVTRGDKVMYYQEEVMKI